MSHSEEQKWENHWRAELDAHAPAPLPGDWTAMSASLDATPGPTPETPTPAPSPTGGSLPGWLTWPVMAGALIVTLGVGIWLGNITAPGSSYAAAPVVADSVPVNFRSDFPASYRLRQPGHHDHNGVPNDTVWHQRRLRLTGPEITPGVRIDTFYLINGRGTVDQVSLQRVTFRQVYDTVYLLDEYGSLRGIGRIDTSEVIIERKTLSTPVPLNSMPSPAERGPDRTKADRSPAVIEARLLPPTARPGGTSLAPAPPVGLAAPGRGLRYRRPDKSREILDLTRPTQPWTIQPLPAYGPPMIIRDRPATYLRPGTRLTPARRPKKRPPLIDNGHFPPIRKRF